ncbi:MAG: hypothetical protein BGO43_06800 [Gammaproteobacteria bacterium 39-13]|nr:hypothetical protein [Gammaproteobacteria bacterium]OJV90545.1 MAG: hypothetical protein BGO43_06800 [Gammaproteobacteria bacterium 39-13]
MKALSPKETCFVYGGASVLDYFYHTASMQEIMVSGTLIGATMLGLAGGWGAYYYLAPSGFSVTWKVLMTSIGAYGGFILGSATGAGVGYISGKITGVEENCILM